MSQLPSAGGGPNNQEATNNLLHALEFDVGFSAIVASGARETLSADARAKLELNEESIAKIMPVIKHLLLELENGVSVRDALCVNDERVFYYDPVSDKNVRLDIGRLYLCKGVKETPQKWLFSFKLAKIRLACYLARWLLFESSNFGKDAELRSCFGINIGTRAFVANFLGKVLIYAFQTLSFLLLHDADGVFSILLQNAEYVKHLLSSLFTTLLISYAGSSEPAMQPWMFQSNAERTYLAHVVGNVHAILFTYAKAKQLDMFNAMVQGVISSNIFPRWLSIVCSHAASSSALASSLPDVPPSFSFHFPQSEPSLHKSPASSPQPPWAARVLLLLDASDAFRFWLGALPEDNPLKQQFTLAAAKFQPAVFRKSLAFRGVVKFACVRAEELGDRKRQRLGEGEHDEQEFVRALNHLKAKAPGADGALFRAPNWDLLPLSASASGAASLVAQLTHYNPARTLKYNAGEMVTSLVHTYCASLAPDSFLAHAPPSRIDLSARAFTPPPKKRSALHFFCARAVAKCTGAAHVAIARSIHKHAQDVNVTNLLRRACDVYLRGKDEEPEQGDG